MASMRNGFVDNNIGDSVWLSIEGDARRVCSMARSLSASIGRAQRHRLSHTLNAISVTMRKDDQ